MENSIELIKSRLSKATEGKWEWVEYKNDPCIMPSLMSESGKIMDFGDAETYYPTEGTPPNKGDIEFIVNAKSDIEYLLKENERLNTAIEQIQNDLFSVRGLNKKHEGEITSICIRIRRFLEGGEYDE